jgi:hypothetical protein
MGEADKDIQTDLDGTVEQAKSLDVRRVYAAPEVTVLELGSVIKGPSGFLDDHTGGRLRH